MQRILSCCLHGEPKQQFFTFKGKIKTPKHISLVSNYDLDKEHFYQIKLFYMSQIKFPGYVNNKVKNVFFNVFKNCFDFRVPGTQIEKQALSVAKRSELRGSN